MILVGERCTFCSKKIFNAGLQLNRKTVKQMNNKLFKYFPSTLAVGMLALSQVASADLIVCGSGQRMAELDSAEQCETGSGNPNGNGSTINAHYGGDWTNVGSETASGNFGSWFDVTLTSGSWGGGDASGGWTISSDFWATYDDAVISMHVGNGGGEPDHWAWLITDGDTSGSWAYDFQSGGGGGLSNLHLWGRGEGASVPEPAPIALMGLGLIGLVLSRKKQ